MISKIQLFSYIQEQLVQLWTRQLSCIETWMISVVVCTVIVWQQGIKTADWILIKLIFWFLQPFRCSHCLRKYSNYRQRFVSFVLSDDWILSYYDAWDTILCLINIKRRQHFQINLFFPIMIMFVGVYQRTSSDHYSQPQQTAWQPPSARHCDCLTTNGQCVPIGTDQCSFNHRANIIRCMGKNRWISVEFCLSSCKLSNHGLIFCVWCRHSFSSRICFHLLSIAHRYAALISDICENEKSMLIVAVGTDRFEFISYCRVRLIPRKYII